MYAEHSYQRTVRVSARLSALYREISSVEGLARFLSDIDHFELVDSPKRAICRGRLIAGPLSYLAVGTLAVDTTESVSSGATTRRVQVLAGVPRLRLRVRGELELVAATARETTLRYSATIRTDHPVLRRMRGVVLGILREHVDTATETAARRAGQYARASQALSTPHRRPRLPRRGSSHAR